MTAGSEGLLDLVLAATLEGLVDHDLLAGTVEYSERWRMLLGFDPEVELDPKPDLWLDLSHPEDRPEVEELWAVHLEQGWPFNHTWRMNHRLGEYRWIQCRSVLRLTEQGEPARALSLFSDVTGQVEANKRHQALAEAIPDSVVRINADGVVLDHQIADRPGERDLLGGVRVGESIQILGGTMSECLTEIVAGAIRERRLQSLPFTYDGDHGPQHFDLRATPSGEREALCLVRDITELKHLEFQLMQSQKLESIGQLAAGIAHEINTPTQFVGDNVRFLRESFEDLMRVLTKTEELTRAVQAGTAPRELANDVSAAIEDADLEYLVEEIPRAIDQSLDGVSRISKIVRSMKEFSHPGVQDRSALDLNHSIESTVTVATNEWKLVADVEFDLDPDLPPVSVVAGQLNQVILNLVVNAAHAIGDTLEEGGAAKGTIRISTRADGEYAEVRIADTGSGIPAEIRSKVFDPFFTTKEVGKGTGQGLAIAYDVVVNKHGGTIDIESKEGEGTTFVIRLALGSPAADSPDVLEAA